jgi:hypothetical protein
MRIAMGYAGVCFKWHPPRSAAGERPPVSLHVGATQAGRGLFLDQTVPAGTLIATAAGVMVELPTKPDKSDGVYYWDRGPGETKGTRVYFRSCKPTIDHPGNLVNTALPGDGLAPNARMHFRPDAPKLALLFATREIKKGDQAIVDYTGDAAFARRMQAAQRAERKVVHSAWQDMLAAEGRDSVGNFTGGNARRRSCPFCKRAPSWFNNDARRQKHIRFCPDSKR